MFSFITIILILTMLWSLIKGIDLIRYTQHLCTRFRIGEIKAMSMSNLSILVIVFKFVHSCKRQLNSHVKCMRYRQVFLLLAVRTSTVATASKKVSMVNSTHHLPLSSLRWKFVYFLLCRINKLDHDFLYWQILSLICPLRNHVASLLSHQFSKTARKDGEYCK